MPRGQRLDLTGQRFGRLVVVSLDVDASRADDRRWRCRCDCGTERVICELSLRKWHTQSCGCLRREINAVCSIKHGAFVGVRRGSAHPPEYNTWSGIIQRCENPKVAAFKDYGGRGVRICAEWRHDFAAFLAHVGPKPSRGHSLDRIDNARGYEPGNVRWATMREQTRNTRRNFFITHDGETLCAADWAERTGVPENTIKARIRRGVPVERALNPRHLPTGRPAGFKRESRAPAA